MVYGQPIQNRNYFNLSSHLKMKTYIKESNINEIDTHIKDAFKSKIRGSKLFALLELINKKGQPIKSTDNKSLNGVKVIEYKAGFFIGFIKTQYKKGPFKLKTIVLETV
tara:strand:- start:2426 stop:2752 length:327 start_codon:yes stop_codon:yes gene_type:complete